ncbi:MAG: GNAT family N-acetyltransferase [Acidobacteria bacterium]|nr:GNAT family N-acetyltransferase [Acidobacteriota bacterium]
MEGMTVRLEHPDAARDAALLFDATHCEHADPGQWTYMAYGPFESADAMRSAMVRLVAGSRDPQWWLVRGQSSGSPVGMAAFMNMVPTHRRLELGHIWYVPAAQRTAVNTETVYLMLSESFDRLGYRCVEWKCDALNARSRTAAARLGFRFEGIFRQHCIVKKRNRDTAWFAMLDSEWPGYQEELRDRSLRPGLPRIPDHAQRAVRGRTH